MLCGRVSPYVLVNTDFIFSSSVIVTSSSVTSFPRLVVSNQLVSSSLLSNRLKNLLHLASFLLMLPLGDVSSIFDDDEDGLRTNEASTSSRSSASSSSVFFFLFLIKLFVLLRRCCLCFCFPVLTWQFCHPIQLRCFQLTHSTFPD